MQLLESFFKFVLQDPKDTVNQTVRQQFLTSLLQTASTLIRCQGMLLFSQWHAKDAVSYIEKCNNYVTVYHQVKKHHLQCMDLTAFKIVLWPFNFVLLSLCRLFSTTCSKAENQAYLLLVRLKKYWTCAKHYKLPLC